MVDVPKILDHVALRRLSDPRRYDDVPLSLFSPSPPNLDGDDNVALLSFLNHLKDDDVFGPTPDLLKNVLVEVCSCMIKAALLPFRA